MLYKGYAKVNLMLRVIKQDDNGYHQLQMINCKVGLADDIQITPSDKFEVSFDQLVLEDHQNIVKKAVETLYQRYPQLPNLKIQITKRIPVQGGLAGGSTDLATVVKAINHQFKLNMTSQEIADLCFTYSSDAVYCLTDHLALVEGYGQYVTPIDKQIPDDWQIVLVTPPVGCDTKTIFQKNTKYSPKLSKYDIISSPLLKLAQNDLQSAGIASFPIIGVLLKQLQECTFFCQLSGSGSTIFGLFNQSQHADVLAFKANHPDCLVTITNIIKPKE